MTSRLHSAGGMVWLGRRAIWAASISSSILTIVVASISPAPGTTGVEVTIAFDRSGERGSFVQGIAEPASGRLATIDDPVRIASISKLVVAIGVMRLVERGRLDLDSDVSRWLGWNFRNPAFSDRPISLRMLLSHTSSVRDHDDQYAIPLGGSVREVMAEPQSWDVAHGPGESYFTYSNMNFPIIASVVERVTGERFDIWMRREVIAPIKLDACFNWPACTDSAVSRAIVLTQDGKPVRDDLGGKRPECPVAPAKDGSCDLSRWKPGENGALFSPQGGLRISARDLARVGQLLLNGGTLDGVRILSPASVDALLRPEWQFNGRNGSRDGESEGVCGYGLSVRQLGTRRPDCFDDPEGRGRRWSGHAGDAYGLRSGLWIDRQRSVGIAYFVTGLDPEPPGGRSSFTAAEETAFRRAVNLLGR